MSEVLTRIRGEDPVMAARKKANAAPLRVHVENNPTTAAVYHVTPALFRKMVRKIPGMAAKIAVSFGNDPAKLDAALKKTEVLLTGGFEASDLSARAPGLKWIQSTSAGVEELGPYNPSAVGLTKGTRRAHP